jgi:RNA polymerase sigma-70 factor (ECF subfamily)
VDPKPPVSDETLLAESCLGRPESFALLVERYEDKLYGLLWRLSRHPQAAQDLFQETWLKAYAARHGFRAKARFSTWLYAIALNLARNWRARSRVHLSLDGPALDGLKWADLIEADEPGALDRLLSEERKRHLNAAIDRLPTNYREVLVLVYQQGMSYQESSEILGKKVAAVRALTFRALQRLRKKLQVKR